MTYDIVGGKNPDVQASSRLVALLCLTTALQACFACRVGSTTDFLFGNGLPGIQVRCFARLDDGPPGSTRRSARRQHSNSLQEASKCKTEIILLANCLTSWTNGSCLVENSKEENRGHDMDTWLAAQSANDGRLPGGLLRSTRRQKPSSLLEASICTLRAVARQPAGGWGRPGCWRGARWSRTPLHPEGRSPAAASGGGRWGAR